MQKKSKTNVVAGILFALIALFQLVDFVIYLIICLSYHIPMFWRNFGFTLVLEGVFILVFILLAVASFLARIRPLPVVGFGLGFLCSVVMLVRNISVIVMCIREMFVYSFKEGLYALAQRLDVNIFFVTPMLVALIFAIIAMVNKDEKPLKAWFVPGIVAALGALPAIAVSVTLIVFRIILYFNKSFYSSFFLYLVQNRSPVFALVIWPLFVVALFCLMKYYAAPAVAAPVYAPAQGYPAEYAQAYAQEGYQAAQNYAQDAYGYQAAPDYAQEAYPAASDDAQTYPAESTPDTGFAPSDGSGE